MDNNSGNKNFKKKSGFFQDLIDFKGLKIELASPKELLSWSYGEVVKPETINYRTWRPEKDGLFCEKIFGPTKDYECYCGKYKKIRYRGVICDKCGVEVTHSRVRRERMGHIVLAAPVSHLWFFRNSFSPLTILLDISRKDFEGVIYFARHLVVEIEKNKRKESIAAVREGIKQKRKEVTDLIAEEINLLEKEAESNKKKLSGKIKNREQLLIAQEEVSVRLRQRKQRLENKKVVEQERFESLGRVLEEKLRSLDVLSVLSEEELFHFKELKADGFFKTGMGAEAVLKILEGVDLKKLVKELKRDLQKTSSKQKKKKIMKRTRLVNGMIRAKIDSTWMILRILPVIPPDLRPMVQLTGGRFATSDLNDLYRRVINRNNRLKRLIELGAPEIILRNEKRMLQESVDILIDAAKSARKRRFTKRVPRSLSDLLRGKKGRFRRNLLGKRVDYSGRSVIVVGPNLKLNQCGLPKEIALEMFRPFVLREIILRGLAPNIRSAKNLIDHRTPEIYDILSEVVKGKLVLLNRAPTLHKLSIQAFEVVLVNGLAIRIHPCICSGFNADFDGDQMGVHLPLSAEAQQEARELMTPTHNLLKPSDGKPVDVPAKEMVVGCYYITSVREEDLEKEEQQLKNKVKWFADANEAKSAWDLRKIGLRELIGLKFEGKMILTTVGRLFFNELLPGELGFVNEPVGSGKIKELISTAFDNLEEERVAELIDALKDIGFQGASYSGVSPSIFDCRLLPGKKELIEKANRRASEIEENYHQGLITKGERTQLIQNMWIETTEEIANLTWKQFSPDDPIKLISDAGIKRVSRDQIKQISGMRGLVVDPLGRIVPLPTKSNFREGLSVFEYVTGARGSRKGLTDTALKTADAGYLTRRLVDVSHTCLVREDDCGTGRSLIISKDSKRGQSFSRRILGRFLAEKVKDPKTKKVLFKKGEIVNAAVLALIEQKRVDEVAVRSPFDCNSKYGVCVKCYGWDLSTRKEVKIGMPVGVVAAQSIGEPGTQLTMRTKHVGGVVGLDVTQGLPRVQELMEVRTPKTLSPLADIDGKVQVDKTDDGYRVTISKKDGKEKEVVSYLIPLTSELKVETGNLVAKGTQLASGSLNVETILRVKGIEAAQQYLLNEIQGVYESQGIAIHDKHFEVIIREMSSKMRVINPGSSDYLVGEYIEKPVFDSINKDLKKSSGRVIKAKRTILGLIQSALHTSSWLSAASFQQTTNVLTEASVLGKEDKLIGLKENVIIGRLIPTDPERAKLE
ncbi:MAG: DNA-directed RNA polymerase subunit beta' [Patescibacteria group bacterium]|nr:DNA-directed RNA polymerase subunit beta' [Patescibacteria group bacterium]